MKDNNNSNNLIKKLSVEGNTSNKLKDNDTNHNNFIEDIFRELENNSFNTDKFYKSLLILRLLKSCVSKINSFIMLPIL